MIYCIMRWYFILTGCIMRMKSSDPWKSKARWHGFWFGFVFFNVKSRMVFELVCDVMGGKLSCRQELTKTRTLPSYKPFKLQCTDWPTSNRKPMNNHQRMDRHGPGEAFFENPVRCGENTHETVTAVSYFEGLWEGTQSCTSTHEYQVV